MTQGPPTTAAAVFTLELEPEPRYVATARLFAAAVARHFRTSEERVQDVKIAISEACSNAIKAHRDASVTEPIRLVITKMADRLRYEIVDVGEGFDYDPAVHGRPRPAAKDPAAVLEGGIGLSLVRALFPDLDVSQTDPKGMSVRFSVELPGHDDTPS
jgi:serine/threonine-protein kinase RsbW